MLGGDYDWWLSGWTPKAQAFLNEQDQKTNRTPQDWKAAWQRSLSGKEILLLERLETGPYVCLVYSVRTSGPEGKETLRSLYAAKYEAGRWLATQDLAEDPFLFHYLEEKDVITITVR